MGTRVVVMAGLVTILLAAVGCSPAVGASPADESNVEVSIDEFMDANHIVKTVEVSEGGVLTVSLGSNPSTGFSWTEDALIGNPAVVQQTASEYVAPETQGLAGASGNQVWTFEALQKGTTSLTMEYGRPWEGGEKGVWIFELTVTVK
jgi:inhibitor of cysteine peptidase